jgi:hypothetical protein
VLGQALAVEVGRVFLLQVRRVEQQDLGQLARRRRAVDVAAKALFDEPRQAADVVGACA